MTDQRTSNPSQTPPEFSRQTKPGDLTPAVKILLQGGSLSAEQTADAFEAMMSGQSHHGEIGALLALLATRTPTSEEILGAARIMRKHVDRLISQIDSSDIVDTAGTGGAPKTFNVSTVAAIIAASAGARVAKHGNRSRTGRGSAEVLKALGVNVDADRATQARCLEVVGVCFCFAIHHHPATKHVMPVRQALGFPTIFNLLGPLTNPAGARRQLMGVYDKQFFRPIAEALRDLGAVRAAVVHSDDGMDEISINAPTHVMHVKDGVITEEIIDPQQLGISPADSGELHAQDLDDATRIMREILTGTQTGPMRNIAILNAAATLLVAEQAGSISDGIAIAEHSIKDGSAMKTLTRLIEVSN